MPPKPLFLARQSAHPRVWLGHGEVLLGIRTSVSLLRLACHVLAIALLLRLDPDEGRHAEIRRQALELVAIRQGGLR